MITLNDLTSRVDETGQPLTETQLQAAAIDTFSVAEEITSNTFGVLRDLYCVRLNDLHYHTDLLPEIDAGEQTYCDTYFTEAEIIERKARSKSGKLFLTKLLPATYINTRNTLLKALENGFSIEGRSKTELEQMNRDAKKAAKEAAESDADSLDPDAILSKLQGLLNTAQQYGSKHGYKVEYSIEVK